MTRVRGCALAFLALAVLARPAIAERVFDPAAIYNVPIAGAQTRGADDALVTIVELSDFSCGFCRRAQATLRDLELLYGDDLRIAFRHHPLDPTAATLAAEAAEAAGAQGRFWAMHDRLFSRRGPLSRALVFAFARDLGLDMARFAADLESHRYRDKVIADIAYSRTIGVRGTPMFFINGRPVRGAQPIGVFVEVIEQELARAKKLVASGTPRDKVYEAAVAGGRPAAISGKAPPDVRTPPLDPAKTYPVRLGPPSMRLGSEEAPVTLVVMSDFECPFCARNVGTLARLSEEYGAALRISYRPFPLSGHPHARLAAEAAMAAAAQGKFWPYHELLFENRRALARHDLERYATAIGLDMARFRRDLDSHAYLRAVIESAARASVLGVTATPTMFVNGTPIRGAQPYEAIKAVIDARLAEAKELIARGVAPADVYRHVTKAPAAIEVVAAGTAAPGGEAENPAAAGRGPIVLDDVDFHIAALLACKSGDAKQAAHFYERLRGERRRMVRADCEHLGVTLPP